MNRNGRACDPAMLQPRPLSLSSAIICAGFLGLYVLLDWASHVQPFGPFDITPWNPAFGLAVVLILTFGRRFVPLLFLGPIVAGLVARRLALPLPLELALGVVVGAGHSLAALALLDPRARFDASLPSMRDLMVLIAIAAASAAAIAVVLVAILGAGGWIAWADAPRAAARYWVGDVIGVAVVTPFLLIARTRGWPVRLDLETAAQYAAIALALVVIFASAAGQELHLFYLLFLPIIWIAVRTGLEGATAGLAVTQLGLMVAIHLIAPPDVNVTALQVLMLVLAFSGLAIGVVVTERRRAENAVRLQQEAHARLARLASMGELATAVAHEVNQPLMAAGTYARIVSAQLEEAAPQAALAREAAAKVERQVERAAEVIRRLRNLVRLGRGDAAPVAVSDLIEGALDIMRPELDRGRIAVVPAVPEGLPRVHADALQIEQVLINLVRNAREAIVGTGGAIGTIRISAAANSSEMVEVSVVDDGPGFTDEQLAAPDRSFPTTKADGLGVGLALSRSMVEANGGALWIASAASGRGAAVHFTLPFAELHAS